MARTFHRKERLGVLSEINVTPLIDLAFALLIIFMITAPLLEQTISLELPLETQNPQSADARERFQTISLTADGRVYWGERAVSKEELSGLLEDLAAQPERPVIHLRAAAKLPYQGVINVIDLIKQNDLTAISLDTGVR
jgi:biopolymer transport protein ExbD